MKIAFSIIFLCLIFLNFFFVYERYKEGKTTDPSVSVVIPEKYMGFSEMYIYDNRRRSHWPYFILLRYEASKKIPQSNVDFRDTPGQLTDLGFSAEQVASSNEWLDEPLRDFLKEDFVYVSHMSNGMRVFESKSGSCAALVFAIR